MDFEDKMEQNVWESSQELQKLLSDIASGRWSWMHNPKSKYLNIRLDTRTGNFLLMNDRAERISLESVKFQKFPTGGLSWKEANYLLKD